MIHTAWKKLAQRVAHEHVDDDDAQQDHPYPRNGVADEGDKGIGGVGKRRPGKFHLALVL